MIRVVKRVREWVAEHCHGLNKRDAVFDKVTDCFIFVPLEPHGARDLQALTTNR
ncbi:MAG: hypothetical protein QOJ70_1761 [Acidobacteriota bacterium]|jgi:hypothetical protein|nr:hypothetical protein [Acidobacteriota bacterium]MDT7807948.1 hypothetical protein [Acidobacteriota bacterium]